VIADRSSQLIQVVTRSATAIRQRARESPPAIAGELARAVIDPGTVLAEVKKVNMCISDTSAILSRKNGDA
jgi:hypothetical protein